MAETVKGRGVTLLVDDELIELKHGDDLSSLPKKVRDAVVEAEARVQADESIPEDADPNQGVPVDSPAVAGIDGFDDLSAADAAAAVTAENAAAVKEYETAHKDRSTVLKACDAALEA